MKVDVSLPLLFTLIGQYLVHGLETGQAISTETIQTRPGREVEMKCLKTQQSHAPLIWIYKQDNESREQILSDGKKFELPYSPHEHILVLKRAEYSDEGSYILKPHGIGRPAICVKHLEILRAPIANCRSGSHLPVSEGRDVSLICIATSGNPTPSIYWYRVQNITENNSFLMVNTSELILKNITKYASGIYRCTLRNQEGSDSCDVDLRVKFTPEIELYESIFRLGDIRNTTLLCRVTGNPLSRVVWTKGTSRTELYSNHLYEINEDRDQLQSHYTIYKILTLIAVSLREEMFGTYWCRITGYGDEYARKAKVIRITDDT